MSMPYSTRFRAAALLAAGLVAVACTSETPVDSEPGAVATPSFSLSGGTQELAEHVVVLREQRGPTQALLAALEAAGATVQARHDDIGVLTVSGLTDAAAAELAARSDVEGINRDIAVQWIPPAEEFLQEVLEGPSSESDQSGTFFFDFWQWNMRAIDADDAWLVSPQGEGALVCILDTGIDPGHAELAGKVDMSKSTSFVDNEPFIEDLNFHGTFVAALVSSTGFAMASVAPDADLCAVKVLSVAGSGSFDDVIAGIMHAADVGADVINMSLGAHIPKGNPAFRSLIHAQQRAIQHAVKRGALVIASAGNAGLDLDHADFIHIPSQLDGVVGVGATGPFDQMNFDQLTAYSNHGGRSVHVVAPGGHARAPFEFAQGRDGILSACSRFSVFIPICATGTFYLTGGFGTSFSAPHAAGHAAVIESAVPGDQRSDWLASCIFQGAEKLGSESRHGRINVLNSVNIPGCGADRS